MGCCERDIVTWRSDMVCCEGDIGTWRSVMGCCEQDIGTWSDGLLWTGYWNVKWWTVVNRILEREVMGCCEQDIGTWSDGLLWTGYWNVKWWTVVNRILEREVMGCCEGISDQSFVINDRECLANKEWLWIPHEGLCFADLVVNFLMLSHWK